MKKCTVCNQIADDSQQYCLKCGSKRFTPVVTKPSSETTLLDDFDTVEKESTKQEHIKEEHAKAVKKPPIRKNTIINEEDTQELDEIDTDNNVDENTAENESTPKSKRSRKEKSTKQKGVKEKREPKKQVESTEYTVKDGKVDVSLKEYISLLIWILIPIAGPFILMKKSIQVIKSSLNIKPSMREYAKLTRAISIITIVIMIITAIGLWVFFTYFSYLL